MAKLLYKPFGLVISVISGALASSAFTHLWKLLTHESDTPDSMDAKRTWSEVLLAATIQGAIFGLVKAATDRGGASGFRRATGTWPGDE
jgi:hypothetical protein